MFRIRTAKKYILQACLATISHLTLFPVFLSTTQLVILLPSILYLTKYSPLDLIGISLITSIAPYAPSKTYKLMSFRPSSNKIFALARWFPAERTALTGLSLGRGLINICPLFPLLTETKAQSSLLFLLTGSCAFLYTSNIAHAGSRNEIKMIKNRLIVLIYLTRVYSLNNHNIASAA
ncbi:hypothetical protein Maes01_02812 [Microbulbifer aestuariivivens]|uniref:Uncharacterized protein n=1 Tax=Microbulbifer aestuariivivens TaxID=1908308 RepID=A0ABP9WUE1_9GAMM